MNSTLKLRGPNGLVVELDRGQVFPDDPGQGTPAMVYRNKNLCDEDNGTYWCAIGEGELSHNGTRLSGEDMDWLLSLESQIEEFLYGKDKET